MLRESHEAVRFHNQGQKRRFCPVLAISLIPSLAIAKADIAHFGFAPLSDIYGKSIRLMRASNDSGRRLAWPLTGVNAWSGLEAPTFVASDMHTGIRTVGESCNGIG